MREAIRSSVVLVLLVLFGVLPAPPGRLGSAAGDGGLVVLAAAPASSDGAPVLHSMAPAPGAVVGAGAVLLQVAVRTARPLASLRLSVDGRLVEPLDASRPGGGDVLVRGVATLAAGDHVARLEVEDAEGGVGLRLWRFHATDRQVRRLAGDDRFATAAAISRATFPDGAASAVLTRGDDYADALSGVPLAAAAAGPLLLALPDALPHATAEELRRVLEPGSTVHLLGGEEALGEVVARNVEALGLRPVRHAGRDRFGTAAAVARLLPPSTEAVLASGTSFPDALAVSAPAGARGLPVLLTAAELLPESATAVLADRDVQRVVLVGGTAAVSERVERQVRGLVEQVERVGGTDRYATAAAVLDAFSDNPSSLSLASGAAFPDALAGAAHAAARAQPLLLTAPGLLPRATAAALRRHQPREVVVYGGPVAVGEAVAAAALRAAVDGVDAPWALTSAPRPSERLTYLRGVTVTFDRTVDAARSSVYVEVAGVELPGTLDTTGPPTSLALRVTAQPSLPTGYSYPGRAVVAAAGADGAVVHEEIAFTYVIPDPLFAAAGQVGLHLPSRDVELLGFHESSHDGAQQLAGRNTATPSVTLPSRGRGTGSRTAVDVVAAPDLPVLAPVTGRIVRAGSYVLYCRYRDEFAVIEPDARPGWEVKLLHMRGLRVAAGQRVVAGGTVLAAGPRSLPFASQVDAFSAPRNWPHVHLEVVDPAVPDRPGRGC